MTWHDLVRTSQKAVIDNSPTILTGLGVAGVVTTAALTGKAAFDSAQELACYPVETGMFDKHGVPLVQYNAAHQLPFKEKVRISWKRYIPAGIAGTLTIACVVGANRIGTRRAAALAAAFTISEKAYTEYRDKVVERFGPEEEVHVRESIAKDRVARTDGAEVVILGEGKVLCFDAYSSRYFESTVETIKKAQNDTNYQILAHDYAALDDFYDRIGLAHTEYSNEVGWNHDNRLELSFGSTLSDDQRPCVVIDFSPRPIRDYKQFR